MNENKWYIDLGRVASYIDAFHIKADDFGKTVHVIIPMLSNNKINCYVYYDGLLLHDALRYKLASKEGLLLQAAKYITPFIFYDDFYNFDGDPKNDEERMKYLKDWTCIHLKRASQSSKVYAVWFKLA